MTSKIESKSNRMKRFFLICRDMRLRSQKTMALRSSIESLLGMKEAVDKEALGRLIAKLEGKDEHEWDVANEVDLVLTGLYPEGAHLDNELIRRLVVACSEVDEDRQTYYRGIIPAEMSPGEKRVVLRQVTEDLHWVRRKRTLKNGHICDIMKVVNVLGLTMFLLFIPVFLHSSKLSRRGLLSGSWLTTG